MKRILIAGLILSAFTVAGQELMKITVNLKFLNSGFLIKEDYHVLKDNQKIWHGPYEKTKNNILIEQGHYKDNKKDSTWIKFGGYGDTVVKGNYAQGKKIGVWQYFTKEGELEQEYDFTKNELLYFKPEKTKKNYQIISGKETFYDSLSRPPLLIGGNHTYLQKLEDTFCNLHINTNYGGTVFVRFIIDETGKGSKYKTIKKGDSILDDTALRIVRQLGNWLPAIRDGKPVKVVHVVPIIFDNSSFVDAF